MAEAVPTIAGLARGGAVVDEDQLIVVPRPGGLRLQVHPGSADALRSLIDIERDCCRWITFELDGPVVTMTSPGAREATIREMWSVAQQVPTGD